MTETDSPSLLGAALDPAGRPAETVSIDLTRDGWTGGYQVAINATDASGAGNGYRILGPKFNGSGETIRHRVLDERDVAEMRGYLDKADGGALAGELTTLRAKVAEYENAVTWNTSCLSCSRVLDSSNRDRERAERAEQLLGAVHCELGPEGRIGHSLLTGALATKANLAAVELLDRIHELAASQDRIEEEDGEPFVAGSGERDVQEFVVTRTGPARQLHDRDCMHGQKPHPGGCFDTAEDQGDADDGRVTVDRDRLIAVLAEAEGFIGGKDNEDFAYLAAVAGVG